MKLRLSSALTALGAVSVVLSGCGQLPERAYLLDPAVVKRAQSIERFNQKSLETEPERPIEEFSRSVRPQETVGMPGATPADGARDDTAASEETSGTTALEGAAQAAEEDAPASSNNADVASATSEPQASSGQASANANKNAVLASQYASQSGSDAPDSGVWDLPIEELRKEVLGNNLQIQAQLVTPAISQTAVSEADAAFESVFSASIDQDRTARKIDERAVQVNTESEDGTYTYGISVPLRTGATVTATMPVTRNYSRDDRTGSITRTFDTSATIVVSQPLLRDAGVAITEAPITLAMLGRRQADAATRLAITNLLANAERFYWQHWAAAREVEIRHDQYQLAYKQLNQAERLAEAGLVPSLEIARSETGLSSRVESIIVAETQRRLAERALKRVINVPGRSLGSDVTVIPTTEPRLARPYFSVDRLLELAMENRMELLDSQLQLRIDRVNLDLARNDQLPSLALSFDYTFRGINRSLTTSVHNLDDGQTAGVGLTLSMPLGNGAAKARTDRASLQALQTRTTEQVRRQTVEQEVRDALDTLEQNWQRILASRNETEMAARIFDAENRQFVRGIRTSTEVLDAAQLLANAQLRQIAAMRDFEISKIELAFSTGTHLGTSRVKLTNPGVETAGFLLPYDYRKK